MNEYTKDPLPGFATNALPIKAAVTLFVLAVFSAPTFAQVERSPRPREASRTRDKIILTLRQDIGELEERDPTPMLRIYKSGLVRVYFPKYMKRAGHYTLHLSDQELESLITSLESKGLMELNVEEVQAEKKKTQQERREKVPSDGAQRTFFYTTDDTRTEIDIDIEDYQPRGAQRSVRVRKKIVWKDLEFDAKRYRNVKSIQNLAAAARELKALTKREDLLKLYNN